MLRFLRINRLAVIDSAEVEFGPGLTVLSGETGAGKSILVGAVGLLLGGRASGDMVRTGEDTATVEAIFETGDGDLVVRREVTAQGRSRAFVNGALATAGALKDLAARLVELHGQHEHQTLLDPATHLLVLDAFGALEPQAAPVRVGFDAYRSASERLARVRAAAADRDARIDLATYQLGELDRAAPSASEDEALLATRQVLANAERLERLCAESYAALYERDDAVLSVLGGVWRQVAELAGVDPQFQPFLEARDSVKSQLEELAFFLRRYADRIEASPARLEQVEERLALLERLKRKYGPTLGDVIARRTALRAELGDLEASDERVAALEAEAAAARVTYVGAASRLSMARREAAVRFARSIEAELAGLAMDRTRFEVRFREPLSQEQWSASGVDDGEFFVSPNPGEELRPLARIVSGGELSRIMLAIKTLAAGGRPAGQTGAADVPGLIFDEVDAGIGGRVADVVGLRLRALGERFQVLCITHLPQIAAYADAHYHIAKHVEAGRTHTTVTRLEGEGRVDEIARMLGGAVATEPIRASARDLLSRGATAVALPPPSESKPKGESERAKAKVEGPAGAEHGRRGSR